MKHINLTLIILALIAAFPTFGSANGGHEETPAQTICPVMVGTPIDPSLYVDYQGERVYLCCKTCVNLFTENPEVYIKNLPQFAAAPAEKHDPATGHGEAEKTPKLIAFIGKFHPMAVHTPIALILGAALAEILFLFTGVPLFRSAARFNLLIAVLGAAIAVPLGLAAASGIQYPDDYAIILFRHKWLGVATFASTLIAVALSERVRRTNNGTGIYRIALLLCVLLVGFTGHLGGLLVFGINHFSW